MLSSTDYWYSVNHIQCSIGYDFKHAPLLLHALGYESKHHVQGSMGPTSGTSHVSTFLQDLIPTPQLANYTARINLTDHALSTEDQPMSAQRLTEIMRAILTAIWIDSGSIRHVERAVKKLEAP